MAVCVIAIVLTANPGLTPSAFERGAGYVIAPLQGGVSAFTQWTSKKFAIFKDNERLHEENEMLREAIMRLELEVDWLTIAEAENRLLFSFLEIDEIYAELPKVGARIIGKDPSDWYDSYNIDKGSNDGMTRNMAIVGSGGLTGVIREVYPTYSKFVSIIDSRCSVAVMNKRTEDKGILRGDISLMPHGLCRMDYINADAQIMAGDELVTSSHSSYLPPGIKVGTIIELRSSNNGMTRYAIVEPSADLNFQYVVLIVNRLFGDENEMKTDE